MTLPTNYITRSLLHALGVLAYISLVANIMLYAEGLFGDGPSVWGIMAFLMLFVLSAAIVGLLIFAKPVMLFLAGERKPAIEFLTATVSWLGILTVVII